MWLEVWLRCGYRYFVLPRHILSELPKSIIVLERSKVTLAQKVGRPKPLWPLVYVCYDCIHSLLIFFWEEEGEGGMVVKFMQINLQVSVQYLEFVHSARTILVAKLYYD